MSDHREKAHRVLKRLLANGPLTAVPTRPSDQEHLITLAAARFEAHKSYREKEVNQLLSAWLETFTAPFGIDHVTLRRLLVDSRLLTRTRSGSTYRLNLERIADVEAVRTLDPARVLAEIRAARDLRKRQHAT
jgi:hypothetical protein